MKRTLATSLLALLLAACGGPAPTVSPTPRGPITVPSPPGQPQEGPAAELPGPGTELTPGHYRKDDFTPRVFFAVLDGWTTVQQFPGFFDIQDDPGSLDVVAVQFTTISGIDTATAEDAAADIEGRDNLNVSEREEVTIGGLPGIRLIADTTDPANSNPVIFRPVLNAPPGPISIGSGRRLEINLFTTPDAVLAIMVGGSIAQWDRAEQLSAPVLESVVVND